MALEVLAKLQDTDVAFTSADSPSMKVVTEHPILGNSTVEHVAWVGCARALSHLVPSLGLWEGPQVESWVDSASNTLLPVLSSGRSHNKSFRLYQCYSNSYALD